MIENVRKLRRTIWACADGHSNTNWTAPYLRAIITIVFLFCPFFFLENNLRTKRQICKPNFKIPVTSRIYTIKAYINSLHKQKLWVDYKNNKKKKNGKTFRGMFCSWLIYSKYFQVVEIKIFRGWKNKIRIIKHKVQNRENWKRH